MSSERWRSSKAASEIGGVARLLEGDRSKSHGRRIKSVCVCGWGLARDHYGKEGERTDGDQVLFDGPHQDADDILRGDLFRDLFQFDAGVGLRGRGGGGSSLRRRGGSSESAGSEVVTCGFGDGFGREDEDLCACGCQSGLEKGRGERWAGLTKDAGLLDPVEDPVDHFLSCDGEEGLDLLLVVASLVVRMVLRRGRRRTGFGLDEGEQVEAVAARDDAAELGFR